MENFRGMAIGIDHYGYWPPLKGAEANAQALYQYFFHEANIPSHQLLLLTDTSPSPGKYSTYPNRENILQWVNEGPVQVKIGWFFFQGYGINYQGEDYLLPIDNNPQAIAQTGIRMRSLLEKLQASTQSLLVILNLKNAEKNSQLGSQTIDLAQKQGISLLLSYLPSTANAVSLDQEMFTKALLESLHYYGHRLTLANLEVYFRERLAPLNRSHNPLVSTPIIVSPSLAVSRQRLLPEPKTQKKVHSGQGRVTLSQNLAQTLVNPDSGAVATLTLPILPKSPPPSPQTPPSQSSPSLQTTPSIAYGKWLMWGGGIIFVMALLWLIQGTLRESRSVEQKTQENQLILDYATVPLSLHQASRLNESIQFSRQIQPNTPLYEEAQGNITRWSQGILEIAQGRAIQEDFIGAIAAAQLVPPDREGIYAIAQKSLESWQQLFQKQQYNQVLIESAIALVKLNEASSYNRGITMLRYINSNEPSYDMAQQLIQQWSQQIYRLAQVRADQGKLKLAIKTAKLVPTDASVFQEAQQAIAQWQQRLH